MCFYTTTTHHSKYGAEEQRSRGAEEQRSRGAEEQRGIVSEACI
jgi:hypothetical protein